MFTLPRIAASAAAALASLALVPAVVAGLQASESGRADPRADGLTKSRVAGAAEIGRSPDVPPPPRA